MERLMNVEDFTDEKAGRIFGFREADLMQIKGRTTARISTRVKTCDGCYADIYVSEDGPNFRLTDGRSTFWGLENVGCDKYLMDPRVVALVLSIKGVSLTNDEISMKVQRPLNTSMGRRTVVQAFHDFYLALAYAGATVMLKEETVADPPPVFEEVTSNESNL